MSVTPEREAAIFNAARKLPAGERAFYLDGACAGDDLLRQQVEELLQADEVAAAFLPELGTGAEDIPGSRAALGSDPSVRMTASPSEKPGDTIDRFKLMEKIGEGGFGVVYVAEQKEPVKRRVALKIIKLGMDTKAVVARFAAERQALALMDHPNIAKVLDAGATDNGRPFFVMELVKGIKLTDYCNQHRLSNKERLGLFVQVCRAIQHAHQKGIIHRDIKPSNILVTLHDGVPVPKVIDFGIAKATQGELADQTVYTQYQQFIGTPAYMSPEQAEMSGLDIDTRSDIYSLGVLLYEFLTGKTPFDSKELMASGLDAMRRTIREKEPARPSTCLATLTGEELTTTASQRSSDRSKLLHQLKGDLDWIVMKAMEKDRTRRYETANALAADVGRYLGNELVAARPPTASYRFQKTFRRNKLAFIAGMVVAAALVIGIGISTWQALVAKTAQREAEQAGKAAQREQLRADEQARKAKASQQQSRCLLYASDMNLAQQALHANNLGKARLLLDRYRKPQAGEEDLRGWEWRYLWQLTRSRALVTLTNRDVVALSVSFSPDGNFLAAGWGDGQVDLWNVLNRRCIRTLTDSGKLLHAQVAFSPVRNLLGASSPQSGVTLHDLDANKESVLWRGPDGERWEVRQLSFSPDGSRLIVSASTSIEVPGDAPPTPSNSVWVVNVSSAKIELQHPTGLRNPWFGGAARLSPDNQRLYLENCDNPDRRYSIQCLELHTGRELWQTPAQTDGALVALAVSPDGNLLASGSGYLDPAIRIWNAETGSLLARLDGHTRWVCGLAFTKDGRGLISASADQTIRSWRQDATMWKEVQILRGHNDKVLSVTLSPLTRLIASAGAEGNLVLWEADGKLATEGYRLIPEIGWGDQLMPVGQKRFLLAGAGRPPQLLDLKPDSPLQALPDIGVATNVIGWADTNILFRWDGTNQIRVHELEGTHLIQRGAVEVNPARRPPELAYNSARKVLAWVEGAALDSVQVASLAEPSLRFKLKSQFPRLSGLLFSGAGNYLLAVTDQASGLIWNVDTRQVVASEPHLGLINNGSWGFAAGGRIFVYAQFRGQNHELVFYDLSHPSQPPRHVLGRNPPAGLDVSPDGGLVAFATQDGLVHLFDPLKCEEVDTLHGNLDIAWSVAFSPNGRRLAVGSRVAEAIELWDLASRQQLLTLNGAGDVLRVQWSPDGDVILAGLPPAQAWYAPSLEEIEKAEGEEETGGPRP